MKNIFRILAVCAIALIAIPDASAQMAQSGVCFSNENPTAPLDTVTNTDTLWYDIPRNPYEIGTLIVQVITVDTITAANAGTATLQYQVEGSVPTAGWVTTGLSGNLATAPPEADGVGGALTIIAANVVGYDHRLYVLSTGTHVASLKVVYRWVPGAIPGKLPYASS